MRLLLDTNIFLEVILGQEKAKDVQGLLSRADEHEFFVTDFSIHSIGVLLFRRNQHDIFRKFLADILLNVGVRIIALSTGEMENIIQIAQKYHLDFDDAYQCTCAQMRRFSLVSFDSDFDRTEQGRKTPAQLQH